uniref:Uncharacterized protein n=1 Tax=Timema shepardi TaxID=629360 RepID=A0A7R9AXK1_TIMSH|nr:unnamed protein product [Timema shepardi]
MTWNIYYFDNFEEVSDGSSMRLGEIHKLSGKGKGDVMIRRLLSGHWYDSVIRDVLLMDEVSDYMKVVEKSANKSVTSLHQLNTVLQQQRQQPRLRNGAR